MRTYESPLAPLLSVVFILMALACAAFYLALIPFAWLFDWLREER